MKISVQTDPTDLVAFHLYKASKNIKTIRKRKNSKYLLPIFYVALSVLLFTLSKSYFTATSMLAFAFAWYFLYPLWERKQYVKHFQSFVHDQLKESPKTQSTLEINDVSVTLIDDSTSMKLSSSKINEIVETGSAIFLLLKGGMGFVLSKKYIVELDTFAAHLKILCKQLGIEYKDETLWRWK